MVLKWTTEPGQTFAEHSSSISGGVGGGLDGRKGLFIHHFPEEEKRENPQKLTLKLFNQMLK